MRTNLLKTFSAAGVFALGLAGAFVTEAKTTASGAGTAVTAYHKANPLGTVCNEIKTCQLENSGNMCRVTDSDPASNQLWGIEGITCTRTLYRFVP
jgi:hypothetical protein